MATTNPQRIDEALKLLRDALEPYFQRVLDAAKGEGSWHLALAGPYQFSDAGDNLDITRLFSIFHEYRNDVFRPAMGPTAVSYMHEAQSVRNRWAHQEGFDTRDTLRALDTIERLIEIAGAPDKAEIVHRSHQQLRRSEVTEQARAETRKLTQQMKSQGSEALVPWRNVVTPHEDVRTGVVKEAEFAADLWQVHLGNAGAEYGDAKAFFRRTYLTEGLSALLETAYRRMSGTGGDPVIELQTNFGGGKTHSMIALYHLASCISLAELAGLDALVQRLDTTDPLCVQRAVLVGSKLSVNQSRVMTDGTTVRTLWGELAWQLAGEAGYRLVAESDLSGHAPGAAVLQQVFDIAGPSLILIDEWVAFIRQLYSGPVPAAGSFEANLTFAQNLTEAVANTPGVLLAASLPSSEIEVAGEYGQRALEILQHTFSRVKASWRPATANESFEIVRRRLFEDVTDIRKRDATINLFVKLYENGKNQFPSQAREVGYRQRMEAAYPFHPETFDQLFEVWGSLERFQRTRGVLRLMAGVVNELWRRGDSSPLIMPAQIPLYAPEVANEMGNYLPDSWSAVIAHDIDGDSALSLALDQKNGLYDRVSATRRVARAVFLGSAPTYKAENKGVTIEEIRLGVVQPGEDPAHFGDALREFSNQATYLYNEHDRYWFSTQPSVTRIAQDRKAQLKDDDVDHAIEQLVRAHQAQRGLFNRVHVTPVSSADVADGPEVSLVILGTTAPHLRRPLEGERSPAVAAARNILDHRGEGQRNHKNSILFLAPDGSGLTNLRDAMREFLVWQEIVDDKDRYDLSSQQLRQAENRRNDAAKTVEIRIRETWIWLLVPSQDATPGSDIHWDQLQLKSLSPDEWLPVAAGKRAESESYVVTRLAPSELRREIDSIPGYSDGWQHIRYGDLVEWYSRYLYLYRLKDSSVLEMAVRSGLDQLIWTDYFAFAERFDETEGRYIGLKTGQREALLATLTKDSLIVHPSVALEQRKREEEAERERERGGDDGDDDSNTGGDGGVGGTGGTGPGPTPPVVETVPLQRYFGSVTINPQTIGSSVSEVSKHVLTHLQSLYGAKVTISLEISAEYAEGFPAEVQEKVIEGSEDLKFEQSDFSEH